MQEGIVIGILYVYCVGPYTSYVAMQYICLIPIAAFMVTFFFMPETPHFYIAKGRRADAIKSLKFLRGKSAEGVQEECDSIQQSVEEAMKNKGSARDVVSNKGNLKGELLHELFKG
jgi:SP family facilitated glucose transporter-like MFS transporter 8